MLEARPYPTEAVQACLAAADAGQHRVLVSFAHRHRQDDYLRQVCCRNEAAAVLSWPTAMN